MALRTALVVLSRMQTMGRYHFIFSPKVQVSQLVLMRTRYSFSDQISGKLIGLLIAIWIMQSENLRKRASLSRPFLNHDPYTCLIRCSRSHFIIFTLGTSEQGNAPHSEHCNQNSNVLG